MRGVSRLQVHGICGRRLVFREVVEAESNYTTAWDGSSGSNRIEKDQIRVLPGLVVGGGGAVWFIKYGAYLDDWTNGGSGTVLVLWAVDPILENGYGI